MLSAISPLDALYAQPALESLAAVTNPTPRGYSPGQIAQAYGFSGITFNGGTIKGDGAGQTIAIVDAYNDPNIVNDLHIFDVTFGIADPPKFTIVNQYGGSSLPATDAGWSEEIALDVEWAHAMAPGAGILLVEANSSSLTDLVAAVNTARNTAGVSVVSMSWGSGEFFSETQFDKYFTTPAGHTGITFIASAGDSGAQATWPAISSNVLSVGGTSLSASNGGYTSESAWRGSGGGYSRYETEPSFQLTVQSSGRRSSPDVSYDANPNTGFAMYDSVAVGGSSGWFQIGGTSAGAPQWAALLAIANQGRVLAGQGTLSGAQKTLYGLSSADFHDVTTGSNGYAARAGYDLVTGRGSPIASAVVRDLVANAAVTSTTTTSPAPSTPTQTTTSGQTRYEWVYWHHHWWLVPVSSSSAAEGFVPAESSDVAFGIASQPAKSNVAADIGPTIAPEMGSRRSPVPFSENTAVATVMVVASPTTAHSDHPSVAQVRSAGFELASFESLSEASVPSVSAQRLSALSVPGNTVPQIEADPLEAAADACFAEDHWAAPLADAGGTSEAAFAGQDSDIATVALALVIGAGWQQVNRNESHHPAVGPRHRFAGPIALSWGPIS